MREIFRKKNYQKGMTLIEMLMVVFIFMTISTMILFNYGKFESSISLQNLADDIALSIREAQSYAIGARGIPDGGTSESFFNGYGIHFTSDLNPLLGLFLGSSPKSFVFFVDYDDPLDKKYSNNASGGIDGCGKIFKKNSECYKIISISSADYISKITAEGYSNPIERVDIVFIRPYPEPSFCIGEDDSSSCALDLNLEYVEIEVTNPRTDKVKTVTITNTGQIVVK